MLNYAGGGGGGGREEDKGENKEALEERQRWRGIKWRWRRMREMRIRQNNKEGGYNRGEDKRIA